MKRIMEFLDAAYRKPIAWFHAHILPNPSGQDQMAEHFVPHAMFCLALLTLPRIGVYAAALPSVMAFVIEFGRDGHLRHFFSKDDRTAFGPADGRCDLFFRLAGSTVPYLSLLWRP